MLTIPRAQTANIAVHEYRCTARPTDMPFMEEHCEYSISYVRQGSFGYVFGGQVYELVAGALLVGHPGDEYMCTHEHHACGDVCLSFKFTPEAIHDIADDRETWRVGTLPPVSDIMVLAELAQAATDGRSAIALDEVALMLVARMARAARNLKPRAPKLRARDRRRVVDVARWIEASSHEEIDLDTTARAAGMSPFHLLRSFASVLGVTPHQYLIRARLRHAARLLTDEGSTVTQIAGAVGFADLSNFIRTFGRAAGMSPQEFRKAARAPRELKIDNG
jgi:AraC family transcriptional regulator